MKVYDGFIFNDELDLLELRLMTLDHVVDYFVLCELPVNFQQQTKRLHFMDNQRRFAKWLPKIRVVPPVEFELGPHPVIENFQRRQIAEGFFDAEPTDWLMMSDVDEIPNPEAVSVLTRSDIDHAVTFAMDLHYYFVNCKMPQPWAGTIIFPRSALGTIDCQRLRDNRSNLPMAPGGWHFSWLGTPAQLQAKLMSLDVAADMAMYPVNGMTVPDAADVEFLTKCRLEARDLLGRDIEMEITEIEPGLLQPKPITEWLERYPQYARYSEVAK